MTSLLCVFAVWQPGPIAPVPPKDVRGVAIQLPEPGHEWFEVTLKREGEDWEDVLPAEAEGEKCSNCVFAGTPWQGLDFLVVFSRSEGWKPYVVLPAAEELVVPQGSELLDEALLNNFGLHQTF